MQHPHWLRRIMGSAEPPPVHTSRQEPFDCPTCSYRMDATTNATGTASPGPGDFSICIKCGQPLQFNARMQVVAVKMSQLPRELWEPFDSIRIAIQMRRQDDLQATRQ